MVSVGDGSGSGVGGGKIEVNTIYAPQADNKISGIILATRNHLESKKLSNVIGFFPATERSRSFAAASPSFA